MYRICISSGDFQGFIDLSFRCPRQLSWVYTDSLEEIPVDKHDERFERIERGMEFLLESDARLSARLDSLTSTVERQQAEIAEIGQILRESNAESRESFEKLITFAEDLAMHVRVLLTGQAGHAERLGELERRLPPESA